MRKTHIKNPVMKQNMDAMYEALKKRVEKVVGRSMVTPRDFDYLAMRFFDANKVCISSTTLKRFWGYIEGCSPRRQTLSVVTVCWLWRLRAILRTFERGRCNRE